MLNNFFKLNNQDDCAEIKTELEFLELAKLSKNIENAIYRPDELKPPRPSNIFKKYKFKNVSFTKTTVTGVEFRQCEFEDCLFIGTDFIECEFHHCTFKDCNPYKAKFSKTYIDPQVFVGMLDSEKHSNIGILLFQQLLFNSSENRQPDFAATAEYNFRQWKRFYLQYEYNNNEIKWCNYLRRWLFNLANQYILGYGVRIRHFLISSLIIFAAISAFNYLFWNHFTVSSSSPLNTEGNGLIKSIYFTIITIATLGYGDITPATNFGMILSSAEVLFGFVWLGFLLSILVKRIIR